MNVAQAPAGTESVNPARSVVSRTSTALPVATSTQLPPVELL